MKPNNSKEEELDGDGNEEISQEQPDSGSVQTSTTSKISSALNLQYQRLGDQYLADLQSLIQVKKYPEARSDPSFRRNLNASIKAYKTGDCIESLVNAGNLLFSPDNINALSDASCFYEAAESRVGMEKAADAFLSLSSQGKGLQGFPVEFCLKAYKQIGNQEKLCALSQYLFKVGELSSAFRVCEEGQIEYRREDLLLCGEAIFQTMRKISSFGLLQKEAIRCFKDGGDQAKLSELLHWITEKCKKGGSHLVPVYIEAMQAANIAPDRAVILAIFQESPSLQVFHTPELGMIAVPEAEALIQKCIEKNDFKLALAIIEKIKLDIPLEDLRRMGKLAEGQEKIHVAQAIYEHAQDRESLMQLGWELLQTIMLYPTKNGLSKAYDPRDIARVAVKAFIAAGDQACAERVKYEIEEVKKRL